MRTLSRPPGGQAVLLASNDRYETLLAARFGRRFLSYRAAWAAASERGDPGGFPLSLDLAVNSGCQLSCAMCPLPARPARRAYRPMAQALYDSLMAQTAEARLAALTLGLASEPLLHPQIAALIDQADRAGIMDIRLGTNGQALSEALIGRLLDSALTRLEISVDAAEAAAYAAVRPGGDFASLERAIEGFLAARSRRGQELPLLRLSFLRLPLNQGQLEPFLSRWQDRVDLISVQNPVWFPDSALPEPPPADPAEAGERGWCVQPWQRLGVDCDGNIWPCCSWYGENLLGLNAKRDALAEVWRSEGLDGLRRSHEQNRLYPPCRECADRGAF
jgi:radical SAM protein with 4Fe4S-binding SPASM domain